MTMPEPPPPSAGGPLPPAGDAPPPSPSSIGAPSPEAPPPTGGIPGSPQPATRGPAAGALVLGIILVVVGALALVARVVDVDLSENAWPLWIIVPGLAMLIGSFAIPPRNGVGLAIAGTIVTTVGAILWVQDTYDLYATWAYAWALVAPTAPAVGTLLYGLVRRVPDMVRDGVRLTLVGLALFGGFALFFEGVVGLSGEPIPNLDQVLPYAVIGLGILMVVLSLFGGRRRNPAA